MARGPCSFRKRDVTRLLCATIAAGVEVQRVEVDKDGKIALVTGKPDVAGGSGKEGADDWSDAR